MTDRSQLLLPLRRRTLLAITTACGAAWVALPVAALLILLAACLTYTVIEVVFVVVLVIGWIALVGGMIAAIAGIFAVNEQPGVLFGGLVAAAIGYGLSQLAPGLNVGEQVFAVVLQPGQDIIGWFIAHEWCVWAWIPLLALLAVASGIWIAVGTLRFVPEAYGQVTRRFHDCPECGRRSHPAYICRNCGETEHDLRPSGYALLIARCRKCGSALPTMDWVGRRRLRRQCGLCRIAWKDEKIGRLPVWHLAVISTGGDAATRTALLPAGGRLVYVHQCGIAEMSNTNTASQITFVSLTDQVLVTGTKATLQASTRYLPGVLGVLERAVGADVRRKHPLPVAVVQREAGGLRSVEARRDDGALAAWQRFMSTALSRVATLTGTIDRKGLRSLLAES